MDDSKTPDRKSQIIHAIETLQTMAANTTGANILLLPPLGTELFVGCAIPHHAYLLEMMDSVIMNLTHCADDAHPQCGDPRRVVSVKAGEEYAGTADELVIQDVSPNEFSLPWHGSFILSEKGLFVPDPDDKDGNTVQLRVFPSLMLRNVLHQVGVPCEFADTSDFSPSGPWLWPVSSDDDTIH